MTTPEKVTQREVRELLRTFAASKWTAMTMVVDGMRVTVGKNGPPSDTASPTPAAPAAATPAPRADPPTATAASTVDTPADTTGVDTTGCVEVRSPAVGAFWVAPGPGQPPFVRVGQTVTAHQQLAIVEVMKLMNPVVAPCAGEIVRVCAANADLVEYDQPLFLIRPADA